MPPTLHTQAQQLELSGFCGFLWDGGGEGIFKKTHQIPTLLYLENEERTENWKFNFYFRKIQTKKSEQITWKNVTEILISFLANPD